MRLTTMFQAYVRFQNEASQYALWPLLAGGEIGGIADRPTAFTPAQLGWAIARLHARLPGQVDKVDVTLAVDYHAQYANESSGCGSSAGYSEACGVWD